MKNILSLIPIILLLAACTCDETHPLVNTEELVVPDVFVVTDVQYTTVLLRDEQVEGIQILFNRNVDREFVNNNETFFLEGNDVYYSGSFVVDSNWIFLSCGDFYCLGAADCKPMIRLAGSPNLGILSQDGELLDGDRDGKPGGDFMQEVSVADCLFPSFNASIFPDQDTLIASDNPDRTLVLEVDFSLPADPGSVRFDTNNDNIKIIRLNDSATVPFNPQWVDSDFLSLYLTISGPGNYCDCGQPCVFRVIIEESVLSLDGIQLDGDGDGIPGGDFIKDYNIIKDSGPLLLLELPDADTTILNYPTDTNILTLNLEFSLPVGPNNFTAADHVQIECFNGNVFDSMFYQLFWEPGSEKKARLELLANWLINSDYCSTSDDPNGIPITFFKVIISEEVRSTGDVQLDGDYDCRPGGNAVKWYIVTFN